MKQLSTQAEYEIERGRGYIYKVSMETGNRDGEAEERRAQMVGETTPRFLMRISILFFSPLFLLTLLMRNSHLAARLGAVEDRGFNR